MDKLTAEIIKEQMIGTTNGHMASIPNSPILYSMFEVYCDLKEGGTRGKWFKEFIKELYEALEKDKNV